MCFADIRIIRYFHLIVTRLPRQLCFKIPLGLYFKKRYMEEYISFEQIPFGSESFADNPEPRCPCVLLLDTSGSMGGTPIQELNAGIETFKQELLNDPLATKRVEVAVVTFGPVKVESTFQTVSNFYPRNLDASGLTPMGEAIEKGIDMIAKRKQEYKDAGIGYFKPWIILITDGEPTDSYYSAAIKVKDGEAGSKFAFFAIAVEDANLDILSQISTFRAPLKLKGLLFREFFKWLSGSLKSASSKIPGSKVNLLPPTGWAEL